MTTVSDIHRLAMELAEQAELKRIEGDEVTAMRLLQTAFEQERTAAERAARLDAPEPTRSILLRSAATLGAECRLWREAERLASQALGGEPPAEVADELRDLLGRIHFEQG